MRKRTTLKFAAALLGLNLAFHMAPVYAESYIAQEGDTFYSLAKKHKIDLDELMKANASIDPLNIYAGLKLELPKKTLQGLTVQSESAALIEVARDNNIITVSGKEMTYKKKVNMKATAYTAHASENGKWGAVDYFGNPLKLGTVAVDPKVIPLGTKLFITGYQFKHLPQGGFIAEARDIGGAVNGNTIDIFVPVSKQIGITFGIQNVEVYIMS
ncbi:3D domain-containing protein [Paenibacillus popilliae]|uniref:Uncharacterized protein conserved in bacteria n=1 Tax=Paenibacillus popilliae ATCC 14706 TaxID=1212764 RepID=M9LAB9_PAEPP|nr:3D domain-containing protein [Paenibacillus popilliae]GAC42552.1 uncharacterized protein conserved in bacteria [Paenibacillus popilliae ATCC 14706]